MQNPWSYYRNNPVLLLPKALQLKAVCHATLNKKHELLLKGKKLSDQFILEDLMKERKTT